MRFFINFANGFYSPFYYDIIQNQDTMATKPFHYQEMFPLGEDTTEYRLITKDYVKTENWNGHEMLVVDPEALTIIANEAQLLVHAASRAQRDGGQDSS